MLRPDQEEIRQDKSLLHCCNAGLNCTCRKVIHGCCGKYVCKHFYAEAVKGLATVNSNGDLILKCGNCRHVLKVTEENRSMVQWNSRELCGYKKFCYKTNFIFLFFFQHMVFFRFLC